MGKKSTNFYKILFQVERKYRIGRKILTEYDKTSEKLCLPQMNKGSGGASEMQRKE